MGRIGRSYPRHASVALPAARPAPAWRVPRAVWVAASALLLLAWPAA